MSLVAFLTQIVAAGTPFTCTTVQIWDGDGPVWCAEGPKVRLAGIAAREIDGTCRKGQPCPNASAADARLALANLLGGSRGRTADGHVLLSGVQMSCQSQGWGKGQRTAARCRLPDGIDVSCAMLKTGTVLRWRRYISDTDCR